jgi:Uma2 family endonuclease
MTLEEYLNWDCEGVHAEWVDGEVVLMSPVREIHQRILLFLARLLADFCDQHELGRIYTAGMRVHLSSRPSGREPDLIFISAGHADRIQETYIDGPADLVVEIMSPESEERDRAAKFVEYEAAGIPEYWLIDPLRQDAVFYLLGEDGRYHPARVCPDGGYQSTALEGFRLLPDWLWRDPLPTPRAAIAELCG